MEKLLDSNYARMLWALLKKSRRRHPKKQQLYGHLAPITKTIKFRRTKHAGHCWRSKVELISDIPLWTPSHGRSKNDYQEPIHNSSRLKEDVALKTYRERWTIEMGGERGSVTSVLDVWHNDDIYSIILANLILLQGLQKNILNYYAIVVSIVIACLLLLSLYQIM